MKSIPIRIRNPDVVRDIRALADRLSLPVTEVIADAVRRRLQEESGKASDAQAAARQRALDVLARIDALAAAESDTELRYRVRAARGDAATGYALLSKLDDASGDRG